MNEAKLMEHFRVQNGKKMTAVYIPEKQNSLSLLFEFFCDLETPIINPIYGIERAKIVSHIPKDGWVIFFDRSIISELQILNLIFYINENC